MAGELVLAVNGPRADAAVPVSLADAGLKERSDLQEWVLAHPEILGPTVMVVAFEFDRWASASGSRTRPAGCPGPGQRWPPGRRRVEARRHRRR